MNLKDLITFVEANKIFSRNDNVLLAVSGGIDSTVMVHLFQQAKFRFAIAHCNFGLRARHSNEDEEFVKNLASQLKVRFFSTKFETEKIAGQKGISIQMAARDLRYDWFEEIRREHLFDYVATAHHLDDQVETFLINLIRGTGIAGLHGIQVKNGNIIRPLMFAYRRDIEQYAKENRINYRTDLSNSDTKYLRNKLRHDVIPLLTDINPEFSNGITESIRRISDFEQIGNLVLQDWCKNAITDNGSDCVVDIKNLLQVKPVEPYAWILLSPFGFNETQVTNILECLKKENRKIFLSPTHRLVKDRKFLVISRIQKKEAGKPFKIGTFKHNKKVIKPVWLALKRIRDVATYEIPSTRDIASLDFNKIRFPLTVRKWQPGDTFFPLGMRRKKKLSDFFIDQKFSLKEKEQTWLICSGSDIVWIIGHRIDHRFRVTSATKEILCIVTRNP